MKPSSLPEWAAYARKAIAAAVGLALNLVALGVVPDEYLPWVQGIIAFLTVIGVYTARNTSTVDDPTTSTAVEAAVEPEGVAADATLEAEPAEQTSLETANAALYEQLRQGEFVEDAQARPIVRVIERVSVDDYQPRHALTTVDAYDHSDDEYPLED